MGRKKPEGRKGRRGDRKRGVSPRAGRAPEPTHNRPGAGGASSTSRLLLTRLLREGAIWEVFIATVSRAGTANDVRLEFARKSPGEETVAYSRPLSGSLLDTLHTGGSLSRAELERELDEAIRARAGEDPEPPAAT